jgi:DNA-binding GntR family transcriptional regulator
MANQTTQVYEALKKKIIKGDYSPSESLPEQELSNQFSVSRNTIKKVLLMLEKESLVTIELNKGAKVRSYSLNEVLEFLELRSCLEGFIIRNAVPVITEEQILDLENTLNIMKQYYENHELLLYSQNNQIFHQTIYDACPNRTAVNMTINLKNQMRKYNTKTILIPGRDNQSFSEHHAIFEAVKNRDAELAQALMSRHILNVRKTFEENFTLLF